MAIVDWQVDDAAKQIIVTVHLDFYVSGGAPSALIKGLMAKAVAFTEKKWRGKFKCYDFILKIDAHWAADRDHLRPGALDVLVDDAMLGTGYTRLDGARGQSLSDDPASALNPVAGGPGDQPRTRWPPANNLVSHEVGHVLGLDDGYTDDSHFWSLGSDRTLTPVPGHPPDVMQDPGDPVLPSTITRVVRRHFGRGMEGNLKCPLKVDAGPSTFKLNWGVLGADITFAITAKADDYDPPSSDPANQPTPAHFTGTMVLAGTGFFLDVTGAAPGDVQANFDLDLALDPIPFIVPYGDDGTLAQKMRWSESAQLPIAEGALYLSDASGAEASDPLGAYLAPSENWVPGPAMYVHVEHDDGAP